MDPIGVVVCVTVGIGVINSCSSKMYEPVDGIPPNLVDGIPPNLHGYYYWNKLKS